MVKTFPNATKYLKSKFEKFPGCVDKQYIVVDMTYLTYW